MAVAFRCCINYGGSVQNAASLSPQRAAVLAALRRRDVPSATADLATELGLHVNTVREHLDGLVVRGLVARQRRRPSGTRGRPSWQYSLAPDWREPDPRIHDYSALAIALARQIAEGSADPQAEATEAGERWGRALVEARPAASGLAARRHVVDLLDRLGFATACNARATRVRLERCPMLDAARDQPDVVCTVHLGMIRGALAAIGGDPEQARLLPFAEPDACLLELRAAGAGGRR